MFLSRIVAFGGVLVWLALVGTPVQAQPAAGARPQTLEDRLNIQMLNPQAAFGARPSGKDVRDLALTQGLRRIICLLPSNEIYDEELEAAEDAGVTVEVHPIALNYPGPPTGIRMDRDMARQLVGKLRNPDAGPTYMHCELGRTRSAFVGFTYDMMVHRADFADAYYQAVMRGFRGDAFPGVLMDMKLLAFDDDHLPTVHALSISDEDLLGQGEFLKVGGVKLHLKRMGSGTPVFMLHGGPGESHTTLRPYFDALADDHTVVYYDQRGCGQSGGPQFAEMYSLDRFVTEVDALRSELGMEKISLIGHSTGGIIAMQYALAYPEHVDKLVLMSTWAHPEPIQKYGPLVTTMMSPSDRRDFDKIRQKATAMRRSLNRREMTAMAELVYPYNFFGRVTDEFRRDWNRRSDVSALVFSALEKDVFYRLDLRDQLRELGQFKVLLIGGRYDVVVPPSVLLEMADSIPSARVAIFDKSGHYPYIEEYDAFIEVVRKFLAN